MTDGIEVDESVRDIADKQNIPESVGTRNLVFQSTDLSIVEATNTNFAFEVRWFESLKFFSESFSYTPSKQNKMYFTVSSEISTKKQNVRHILSLEETLKIIQSGADEFNRLNQKKKTIKLKILLIQNLLSKLSIKRQ